MPPEIFSISIFVLYIDLFIYILNKLKTNVKIKSAAVPFKPVSHTELFISAEPNANEYKEDLSSLTLLHSADEKFGV